MIIQSLLYNVCSGYVHYNVITLETEKTMAFQEACEAATIKPREGSLNSLKKGDKYKFAKPTKFHVFIKRGYVLES